ncbi:hypothetical protein NQ318_004182 [Aromia moschata]|uniref:Uncharacterized protein n=1 Tax=Aromia moschata TaxID=1265417 RepID=A0AAV8XPX4_9CUCU|nr:hypothetical protein NQ318_004182 [Aromia moschata]
MASSSQAGSRRGSGLGLTGYQSPRPPPLATTKSNSLSLPDSPTVAGYQRGRSSSLRVIDDILLRRSNSLRQGLTAVGASRRKSSLEDIGLSHFSTNYSNPIKIALNGSIGLEVTPPEENSPPVVASNTALVINPSLPPVARAAPSAWRRAACPAPARRNRSAWASTPLRGDGGQPASGSAHVGGVRPAAPPGDDSMIQPNVGRRTGSLRNNDT